MANEQNLEQRIGEHVLAVRAAQGGVDVLSELVNALEPRDLLEVSERMRRFADAVYYTATACLVKESERALESHLDEVAAESDGMETSIRSGKLRDRAPEEVVAQEIAVIRGIARLTAAGEVERAQLLAHDTPEAIEGLAEGAVSGRHVMTAADLARHIEPERVPEPSSDDPAVLEEHARDEATRRAECAQRRQEFAGDLLAQAGSKTPGQLERYGKRRLEQELSEDFETRNRRARSARFVSIESTDDGMAYLTALIPTLAAEAIDRRLADFAAVQKKAPTRGGDGSGNSAGARTIGGLEMDAEEERQRTQQQVKADAFVDLLLGSPEAVGIANVKPEVTITVPVTVLRELEALGGDEARNSSAGVGSMGSLEATDRRAGSGDQTGFRTLRPETERFGAFGQEELAAVLANAATWTRVITDPWDGAIASFDSKAYKPPAALRRALQLRDRTCRVPGCGRRATNCEPDHVIEWRHGGPTDLDNLSTLR